ncbi:MAG: AAA family ATPase [Alphaproteobacteria bacterium]
MSQSTKKDIEEIRQRLLGNIEQVLKHLLPAGKIDGHNFHVGNISGDPGKSLSVTLNGESKGLWKDFATGESGDLLSLWAAVRGKNTQSDFPEILDEVREYFGIEKESPSPAKKPPRIEPSHIWEYKDVENNILARVYRYDTSKGKTFSQWDGETQQWRAPKIRPLYNQMGMIWSQEVVLVEGEKCADALKKKGIAATSAMGGANAPIDKTDWTPLKDKDVTIWPDNDKIGIGFAEKAAKHLQPLVKSLKILKPPKGKADKWDVVDAIDEGFDYKRFIASGPTIKGQVLPGQFRIQDWKTDTRYKASVPERRYLVEGVFPLKTVCLLAAMGDTGKSMMLLDLALQVARKTNAPAVEDKSCFGGYVKEFGSVVFLTAEEDQEEVNHRLLGLDPRKSFLKAHENTLYVIPLPDNGGLLPLLKQTSDGMKQTEYYKHLRAELSAISNLKAIILDPLASFAGVDINADPAAGAMLTSLMMALATETGATVIMSHHMRKPSGNKPIETLEQARDSIRGTTAIVDGSRFVYALWHAPKDEQNNAFISLDEPFRRNAIVKGAVVKSNFKTDRRLKTYLRNEDNGLLEDVTFRLSEKGTEGIPDEVLLQKAIARAAANGDPFTHTGKGGLFLNRERLPKRLQEYSRPKLELFAQELLSNKEIVKCRAGGSNVSQWLDIPKGPFARGEGEFQKGAENV